MRTGVHVPEQPVYDDFVRISNEIMRGRGSKEQRLVVRDVLNSLMPKEAPPVFRWVAAREMWARPDAALRTVMLGAVAGVRWDSGTACGRCMP